MIESPLVQDLVQLILLAMIGLLIPISYRVVFSKTLPERLQAVDLITTLLVGIIVVLTLVEGSQVFIDLGIALAAFSFIGTISIARYISEGRVF